MTSLVRKLGFMFIGLLFSTTAFATPILVFESVGSALNKVLVGVDDVTLGDNSYDVRFTHYLPTIFEDQASADAASIALFDQVFSTESFRSLRFCDSNRCGENAVWFERYFLGGSYSVQQYWGDYIFVEGCDASSRDCMYKINASNVSFHGTSGIRNYIAMAPWKISCDDCGPSGAVWTKRVDVPEPSSFALLMVSLAGLVLMRAKRFNIAMFRRS